MNLLTRVIHISSKRLYSTPAYHIERTANRGLPVYSDYKNGGTRVLTIVRRIKGDSKALLDDIKVDLPELEGSINPATQHVVIKGQCVNDIKEWLILKGF
ncbi:ribosomal protein L49/IMG2 [Pilobolus umbonatus]|nr:ribosomal protein L49/IMG2 [Pilobolus umbonatus]